MTFASQNWETRTPEDLGFDAQKLAAVETYLRNAANEQKKVATQNDLIARIVETLRD